jgi:hypothetical protein
LASLESKTGSRHTIRDPEAPSCPVRLPCGCGCTIRPAHGTGQVQ